MYYISDLKYIMTRHAGYFFYIMVK